MLQAQKVRVVNYLDDEAKNLNKFGENANAELEEIGKSMLSDLDETSDKVSTFAQFPLFFSVFVSTTRKYWIRKCDRCLILE